MGTRASNEGPLGALRLPGVKEKCPLMVPVIIEERGRGRAHPLLAEQSVQQRLGRTNPRKLER